jgi:hypothetical protein
MDAVGGSPLYSKHVRKHDPRRPFAYGADPDFQVYTKQVPVIVPLLPVYSLKNAKIHLG